MNMPSINLGVRVSGMPKFPDIAQAYARTFHDQKETQLTCDWHLTLRSLMCMRNTSRATRITLTAS